MSAQTEYTLGVKFSLSLSLRHCVKESILYIFIRGVSPDYGNIILYRANTVSLLAAYLSNYGEFIGALYSGVQLYYTTSSPRQNISPNQAIYM